MKKQLLLVLALSGAGFLSAASSTKVKGKKYECKTLCEKEGGQWNMTYSSGKCTCIIK